MSFIAAFLILLLNRTDVFSAFLSLPLRARLYPNAAWYTNAAWCPAPYRSVWIIGGAHSVCYCHAVLSYRSALLLVRYLSFLQLALLEREKHDLILDVQERVRTLKVSDSVFGVLTVS